VNERVQLHERHAESPGKLAPDPRLAVAAGTRYDSNLPHHRTIFPPRGCRCLGFGVGRGQ
jgi:hypothetical protein